MKYTFYQYQKINNLYQLRENGGEVIAVNNRVSLYNTVYYYKNIIEMFRAAQGFYTVSVTIPNKVYSLDDIDLEVVVTKFEYDARIDNYYQPIDGFVDKTTARKINGLIGAYTKKVNVLKRGEVLADKVIKNRRWLLLRTLPIREMYAGKNFYVIYSGVYKIINKQYHLVFIANSNKCIKDIALYPMEDIKKELYSISICGEKFPLVK